MWSFELCQVILAILSENMCNLHFPSLIETPGDLADDDIACHVEWDGRSFQGL